MIGEPGILLVALYGALLGARHALEPDWSGTASVIIGLLLVASLL